MVTAVVDTVAVGAQAWGRLEFAVGGKGHPQVFEAVRGELHLSVSGACRAQGWGVGRRERIVEREVAP